jgi:hypothetical protein
MYHYFGTATDKKGNAQVGWTVEATDASGIVQAIYSDENGTAIATVSGTANRALTNSLGNYDFWIADGEYNVKFYNAAGILQSPVLRKVPMFTNTSPLVTAEQYGATGYTTAAAAKAGVDNRTAIQTAINALVALGGGTILYSKPHYGVAAPPRMQATDDITTGLSGIPLIIDGAKIIFKSTCGRTDIWRRAQGMADPATWANWPMLSGGGAWRGSLFMLKGQSSVPANLSQRAGIRLEGVYLQGGILRGSIYGEVNTTTGDGWDTTDHGIWCDGGTVGPGGIFTTGDIEIVDGGIIGFRGELAYGSNDTVPKLYVRNGTFGETNGSCLNANSMLLDVDGALLYNTNIGIEGWTGERGQFNNVTIENAVQAGPLAGGKFGAGTFSPYYAPTRVSATVTPYGQIDSLVLKRCGPFYPGSWINAGKITVIDGQVIFDGRSVFADGMWDAHVSEIVVITDQLTNAGVGIVGGDEATSASQSVRNLKIDKISLLRTKDAVAAGRLPGTPVAWFGSLGPRIVIGELHGECSSPPRESATTSNNYPAFLSTNLTAITGPGVATQNVQTTPALAFKGPRMELTTTGSAVYAMTLQTSGIQEGAELTLINYGPGQVYINGNISSGSGFRDNGGPVFLPLSGTTRFRFDGNFWNYVDGGARTFTTTVANLPAASADWQNVRAFVTDSNATHTAGIGAVVAAGGANKVPVTCDGTDWRIG